MKLDAGTLLTYYSTYSESVAALVGLSAAFAIFRYQSLRNYFSEKVGKIYEAFSSDFRGFLTSEQWFQFKDFVNHEQRASYVEPIYRSWLSHEKKPEVHQKLGGNPDKVHEFQAWSDEFSDYKTVKGQMSSFRSSFLLATSFGLIAVFIGLVGIVLVDIPALNEQQTLFVWVTALLLIVYLALLYRLLSQSFQRAE